MRLLSDLAGVNGLSERTLRKIANELNNVGSPAIIKLNPRLYMANELHPDWVTRIARAVKETRGRPRHNLSR